MAYLSQADTLQKTAHRQDAQNRSEDHRAGRRGDLEGGLSAGRSGQFGRRHRGIESQRPTG